MVLVIATSFVLLGHLLSHSSLFVDLFCNLLLCLEFLMLAGCLAPAIRFVVEHVFDQELEALRDLEVGFAGGVTVLQVEELIEDLLDVGVVLLLPSFVDQFLVDVGSDLGDQLDSSFHGVVVDGRVGNRALVEAQQAIEHGPEGGISQDLVPVEVSAELDVAEKLARATDLLFIVLIVEVQIHGRWVVEEFLEALLAEVEHLLSEHTVLYVGRLGTDSL